MKKFLLSFIFIIVLFSVTTIYSYATENAMFPMKYLNISQGVNETYSHQGRLALDICGRDTGKDAFYAPFTGTIKKVYGSDHIIWLESNDKVRFADGTVDYMTIMCMHDDDISDLYVGKVINQGEHFLTEGMAGSATGNHIHIECGKGKFTGSGWYQNSYGKWCINNSIMPYDALFLDNSTIIYNNYDYNWRYVSNSDPPVPAKPTISSVVATGGKVTVNWNSVSNATNYDVFIVESPWGTENIIASLNTNSTSCTFDIHKEGSFCAFVAAKNSAGNAGESSEWYSFTVTPSPPNAPVLDKEIANNDYYISDTITASWSAVSNAKDYEYFLTQYPTGYAYGTTKVKGGTVTGTSVSFKNLPIGRYSLFVVAKNSGGSSPQSNWVTFTVNPTDYIPKMVTYNNNHIYAVYDYSTNWDYARSLCEYFGGHLATVTSKEENDLITSIIQYGGCDGYWLGGSDYKSGDYGKDYVPYFWLNGETFSYSNWADGEPSRTGNEGYKEHFLTVRKSYGNKWNDESALNYDNKGFILEIEMDSADMENMRFGNNEYIRFDKNMNWVEAETYCNSLGGHLVTYESKEEYSAVTDLMDNGKKNWFHIGATKNRNDWYWISNDKLIENDYLKFWSYYDPYGEYLMEYVGVSAKKSGAFGKFAGLKNAYSPFKYKENLGFVCEIDNYYADIPIPASWSITSYNGDTVIITAPLDAVPGEKNYLYAAGYSNNGELIDFDMIEFVVESGKIRYELSDLKEIKGSKVELMLWNSDMQPLSKAFEK